MFCGYCNSAITAETGTSRTGKVYHYYKCYGKKLKTTNCSKKSVEQDYIETLVFETTLKYVLQPKVIERIAALVTEKFNSEIEKPFALLSMEKQLKEVQKSIANVMAAIENGVFTKSTKERLLDLEARQSELEEKIAFEQSRQIKPLEANDVKKFLMYFAYKKYERGEEKNEFFNSFINRVVLYDDKILIFYNTDTNRPAVITRTDTDDLLAGVGEKIEKRGKSTAKNEKNSLEPYGFKRVSLGGKPESQFELFMRKGWFGICLQQI